LQWNNNLFYDVIMVQQPKRIQFDNLIKSLRTAMSKFPDKRTGKNIHYEIIDAAVGAFSIFFTQSPSFLSHQRLLKSRFGMSNAHSLFKMDTMPTDTHIRDILDEVSPEYLHSVFNDCYHAVQASGDLDQYCNAGINNTLLLALDGTWYFSSEKIHCATCSTKKKDGTVTYYHGMINPVIVAPANKRVIALPPEYITPQDGDKKQDCEHKAAKRWIAKHKDTYNTKQVTILGDDLYAHEPMCRELLTGGFDFLLVCKPDSHKTLYEWITGITEEKTIRKCIKGVWQTWQYRFVSKVPLRNDSSALEVNWCELTITRDHDNSRLYKNAFITNHQITEKNIEQIIACGRTRWKTENENNNTLKTKGYYLEHNYGHGKHHLASLLATMNILAFLFHTILEFMDESYRSLREKIGRRDEFFGDIRTLFKFGCFTSWSRLLWFMHEGLERPHDPSIFMAPI